MKSLITILTLILFCQTVTAQTTEQKDFYTVDTKTILTNRELSSREKAELLALASERMVQMSGFMYAGEVVDLALQLDNTNVRAKFWKSYLETNESFRGWYSRFEKLIFNRPADETRGFYRDLRQAKSHPAFYRFITEERPQLENESDVQAFVDSHIQRLDNFRSVLSELKGSQLTVTLYDVSGSKNTSNKWGRKCTVSRHVNTDISGQTYTFYHFARCKVLTTKTALLDRSDFEALQHTVAGNQLLFAVMNAYKLDGAISAYDSSINESNKSRYEAFFNDESFGVLRSESFLKMIHSLGVDALAGYKHFVNQRQELCPNGVETPEQREGKLYSNGICVIQGERNYMKIVELVEKSLDGEVVRMAVAEKQVTPQFPNWTETRLKPVELLSENEKTLYETDMIVASPLLNPIQDLRTVGPTQWNNCDRVTNIASADAGGALPYRDSADVLQALEKDCQ